MPRAIRSLIPAVFAILLLAATVEAVKTFQAANGLTANGIVGTTTWEKLIVGLTPGSSGEAVKVVQRELNAKRRAGLAMTGHRPRSVSSGTARSGRTARSTGCGDGRRDPRTTSSGARG